METEKKTFSLKSIKRWLIGGVIVVLALLGYSRLNDEYNESVRRESQLSMLFLSNQNELSAYVSTFYEEASVANMKSEKMTKFMTDAVRGRYDKNGGFDGSAMVSMLKEAYPDMKEFGTFDKIIQHVKAGRESFKGKQEYLLDQIRTYKNWYREGFVRGYVMKKFIPSVHLEARIGDKVVTGKEALDLMERIILTGDTKKAYETGVMDPLTMPK